MPTEQASETLTNSTILRKEVRVLFAYILNGRGEPLMPCSPRTARLLLKQGKAKVLKMVPFTLRLLHGSSGYTQEVSLGIDAGTRHIGVSATTEHTVLFEAEVQPRQDIQELLSTRQQFRRARRHRKTRYRKARFLNRKKPKGWLAPSVKHKVDAHVKTINLVHAILPVKKTIIEVAQFDLQKIRNPEIEGTQYQEGPQLGFWNVREYVLARDSHCCQWCQGKSKDKILNVHHIESRKTGGDRPDNLITLCETCHDLIHRTHQEHTIERPSRGFRDATQMGIIRWAVFEEVKKHIPNTELTYGYLTKKYAYHAHIREIAPDGCTLHQWTSSRLFEYYVVSREVGQEEQRAVAESHDQEGWEEAKEHGPQDCAWLLLVRQCELSRTSVLYLWPKKFRLL